MKMNKTQEQTKDFAVSVLRRIKKEKIEMIPRWQFSAREVFFWFFVGLSIMTGSVFFSIILLHSLQIDIAIAVRASGGIVRHIIAFAPYLWLFLLIIVTLLAWYNFKKTKRGYKYSYVLILMGSILASGVIGLLLYFGGAAQHAERYALQFGGQYYKGAVQRRETMWHQPERGLLSGVPLGTLVSGSDEFALVDTEGITWMINSADITEEERAIIAVAAKVAIIGTMVSESKFTACRIIPWAQPHERGAMKRSIEKFLPEGTRVSERNIFDLRNSICERK